MSAFVRNFGQGENNGISNPKPCRDGGNCFKRKCFFNHPEAPKSVAIHPVKPAEKTLELPVLTVEYTSNDLSFRQAPVESVDFSEYLGDDVPSDKDLSLLEVEVEVEEHRDIIDTLNLRVTSLEQEVDRLSQPTSADQAIERLTRKNREQAQEIESLKTQMTSMQAYLDFMHKELQALKQVVAK